ncbi:MAG: CPBP family intramembrane metalloprotease [Cyanobacteria bacterium SBLK]|nr:CPBP family intramembrane metalloprotease [Cyanobacteria bacterium SBLK]
MPKFKIDPSKIYCIIGLLLAISLNFLVFPIRSQNIIESNYKISQRLPFNQLQYYPLEQEIDKTFYHSVGNWVGRLILPTIEEKKKLKTHSSLTDWVWFEIYNAPSEYQNLEGKNLRLEWKDTDRTRFYVEATTTDIRFSEAVQKSVQNGNINPLRLENRDRVGPLESLAGARPQDDLLVSLKTVNLFKDKTGEIILQTEREPIQVTGRYYTLVDIIEPLEDKKKTCLDKGFCPSEYFRVRHYNQNTQNFDGFEEVIRIPQQPKTRGDRVFSTPDKIFQSPAGHGGWYIYGAKDKAGIFTVQAIKPRALVQLQPDRIILGKRAGFNHIKRENWRDLPQKKGNISTVLIDPKASNPKTAISTWQEGDRALVLHLFGGIGGNKRESHPPYTVTGHFSYGIAEIVRDRFTDELQWDIQYQQIYAHNPDGIVSGTLSWETYMGNLQRGWMGIRPVSDILIKLDVFTGDYNFGETRLSLFRELLLQTQIVMARYRTGDGTGNTAVTPATSCVQDSSQSLYIAIEQIKHQATTDPAVQTWRDNHPQHPQTQKITAFIALARDLMKSLTPRGTVRPDWQQNAEYLAGINNRNGFVTDSNLVNVILSWRSLFPRRVHDEIANIFLDNGASLWVLRTNQVGGFDAATSPLAPTVLFGQIPPIAIAIERLASAFTKLNLSQVRVILATLIIYGAIAIPLARFSGFIPSSFTPYRPLKQRWGLIYIFFFPAFFEELIFRVLLLPHPTERVATLTWGFWAIASLFGYIIYHPLNARTFYRAGNPTFFKPIFLILTGLLGLACTIAYFLTYSIWVIAIVHWLVVAVWLFTLDGKKLLQP